MDTPSRLEREVLQAIAAQASQNAPILNHQIDIARVANRENTGAGFFTSFTLDTDQLLDNLRSPVGDVGATVEGLYYGMSFLLWVKNGLIHQLEGYAYGEDTTGLNFEQVAFRDVQSS